MKLRYIFYFLLISIYSCVPDSDVVITSTNNKINYESEVFNLYLDNFTPFGRGISIVGFTEDRNIVLSNAVNHSIDFYSLNTGKFQKRIKITREGPNAVPLTAGAKIVGSDSILIFSQFILNQSKLYSISSEKPVEGESFFGNWSLFNNKAINIICTYFTQPVIYNGHLYLMTWPTEELNFSKKSGQDNLPPIEFKFNLKSKELSPILVQYPPVFYERKYPAYLSLPLRAYNNNEKLLVYCWPLSEKLGIYDMQTESFRFEDIQKASIKANYNGPSHEDWPSILNSHHYKGIMYDPESKLYFRFFSSPIENPTANDYRSSSSVFRMPLSIQVIDSSFTEIGIIDLKDEKYDFGRSFIFDNQIYLSTNNIFNKNIDENILRYEVIRLYLD